MGWMTFHSIQKVSSISHTGTKLIAVSYVGIFLALSVEELFSGECLDTEEKLKVFLNNYVIR